MGATVSAGPEVLIGVETRLAAYYRSPYVRDRIAEYCGGHQESPASFSATGLAGYGGSRRLEEPDCGPVPVSMPEWTRLLNEGADVCRSLADRVGTLLQLDLDYVNHDDPAEPYRDPPAAFARLEPVYRTTLETFERFGLRPLVLMTGRGYHFTLRAPRGGPLHTALLHLGRVGVASRARRENAGGGAAVEDGRAHEGAGRLLEYLAHEVVRSLTGRAGIPVTLADLPPPDGGAFACLDLSAYGDPLCTRYARCAFSTNQKPFLQRLCSSRRFVLTLPRRHEPLPLLLRARENPAEAVALAAVGDARIPAALGGIEWVEAYRASELAVFHRDFDRGPHVAPALWPYTYDSLDLQALPRCVRLPLEHPNPLLLVPGWIRTVALALWNLGWHPRSVAGLVHSKYEGDHGWGRTWERYDPETRAALYVRLSIGAVATGVEDRKGFTCESQARRGLCVERACGWELAGAPNAPRSVARRWR